MQALAGSGTPPQAYETPERSHFEVGKYMGQKTFGPSKPDTEMHKL